MKSLLGMVGAGIVAAALFSNPADARPTCVWEGHAWRCWNSPNHHQAWRDRDYRHRKRAELRHDRHRVERLRNRLERDIHSGNSAEIRRTHRALRGAERELRMDRRELRRDRWGE
jgi:hypothetical protein